ncbi:hypothetical protein [Agrococcus beijingensis]|uniref:hypothetical protein n=1 Tax=Agrococcus beijingensis TaxID=3068634 RepID=UPI002741BAA0|nr:hypothetical protein [Agrococcus sp. REN33]
MTAVEHRAHSSFAMATPWVSMLAIAIGVVTGAAVALAAFSDPQGLAAGAGYGLVPGVLAAIGVSIARRAVVHRTRFWRALGLVVVVVAAVTAVLFAITQLTIEMAVIGFLLGAFTAAVATFVGLLRVRR